MKLNPKQTIYLKINIEHIKKARDKQFIKEFLKTKPIKIKEFLFYSIDESLFKQIKSKLPSDFEVVDHHTFEEIKRKYSNENKKERLPSFDVIGNIAIISKEYGIEEAEKIMKVNKNIKSVYRETGKHETAFRIQPLELLKGEINSETIHKENNTILKLDVKKVYFSPRLGTERLRIIKQIKSGERVMILFSGVGPYVYEIAKNTKAKYVYGIELNPYAHYYSYENKFLNKTTNTLPLFGDVREIMPRLPQYIFGLKSSIDKVQLQSRNRETRVYEIHTLVDDLYDENTRFDNVNKKVHNIKNLINTIRELKKRFNVFVHMPTFIHHKKIRDVDFIIEMLKILGKLAKEERFYVVVHLQELNDEDLNKLFMKIEKYFHLFFFENLIESFRYFEDFLKIKDKIRNVALDLSHLAINLFNKHQLNNLSNINEIKEKLTKALIDEIKKFDELFNLYFHVAEFKLKNGSACEDCDGTLIENKYIDFNQLLKYTSFGIVEVKNVDENNPLEMLKSHEFVSNLRFHENWFDRIAMPLPLGAESFLDYAIPYVKNHGIIHLYDFVDESEFPKLTIKKFDKFAKKYNIDYKVLNAIKTAEIAPKKYRICLDIEVIKRT